jgi:hypothetical protein
MQTETEADDEQTATVTENDFNGTANLTVKVPAGTDKRTVERVARRFFEERHGIRGVDTICEKDGVYGTFGEVDRWEVAVIDGSSGSLVDGAEYEIDG